VVVVCPRCKTRLKVDEHKLSVEGSRFKCPKCTTVLLVKKPSALPKKGLVKNRILVAHSNQSKINEITSLLLKNGYKTITSSDGIDAMIKSIKELPFLALIEVSLPKIYGFEVCKRLKQRAETKEMKCILITSAYDKRRYRREPADLHGADDYIEEHNIPELLIEKINTIKGIQPEEKVERQIEEPVKKPEQKIQTKAEPEIIEKPVLDQKVERAKRLARAIISDIYLYNTAKADESIRNNNFYSVFEPEIKEGLKLYENRISQDVRIKGDFFREAINNFIENKKKLI
jgi:predicted Zn finger-like uncharacterized protein